MNAREAKIVAKMDLGPVPPDFAKRWSEFAKYCMNLYINDKSVPPSEPAPTMKNMPHYYRRWLSSGHPDFADMKRKLAKIKAALKARK